LPTLRELYSAKSEENHVDYLVAVLVLVIGFGGVKLYANRRRADLDWPRDMDFFAMRRRVDSFFKRTGWQVRNHILKSEMTSPIDYDFVVSRNSREFLIKCYPSGMASFATALKDLSRLRSNRLYVDVGLILVTAEKAPWGIMKIALDDGIFLLHYKTLNRLGALDAISTESLRHLVEASK
jgi:hypothetical protein